MTEHCSHHHQGPLRGWALGAYESFFGLPLRLVAPVVLLGSFFFPRQGIGFDLCLFKRTVALPCPGCGVTRSLANLSQMHWLDAFAYHPFGVLVWAALWIGMASWFLGHRRRQQIRTWFAQHQVWVSRVYSYVIVFFLAFGAFRLMAVWFQPGAFLKF